ncbi:MAG: M15 family metallopeptidase [bacterium]
MRKPYEEVTGEEKDPASRCSVCEADQITIKMEGIPKFRICKYFAGKVKAALLEIRESGFPIRTVIGYRVGRTRGTPDAEGLRTRFSNHSFGTAIDLNAGLNGLYSNCLMFGKGCRLIRGGHWRPHIPGTLTAKSIAVAALKAIGWKWGGEIAGSQKDFMHFSLTGY